MSELFLLQQDIFKFQIAVDDALAVHVLKHVEHLTEEESAGFFAHVAKALANVEQQTA